MGLQPGPEAALARAKAICYKADERARGVRWSLLKKPMQRPLDAYNARDLEQFLCEYADDIVVYRPPATESTIGLRSSPRSSAAPIVCPFAQSTVNV